MNKRWMYAALLLVVATGWILYGCGQGSSNQGGGAADNGSGGNVPAPAADAYTGGPVELLVQDRNTGLSEEEFAEYFAKPVKAKYPDITLKLTRESNLDKLVAGGTPPDLVAVSNARLNEYFDADYPEDLTPMIKRFNINLDKIEPSIVGVLKGLGRGGIYGLPFGMNYGAMIYNKDLFDKFGVSYPKDVITWDEFLELSKRLTRSDGGVQYIGGAPNSVQTLLKQYGAPNVDANDERVILTSEKHAAVYSLLQKFFDIPGLIQGKTYLPTQIYEGKVAMQTNWVAGIAFDVIKNKPTFQWDIAAYPVFKERPNIGAPVDFHMLIVNKATKNKEAAYRVLLTMLAPDVQEELTKNIRITPFKDLKLKSLFAQNSKVFDGKNLQAVFKVSPAPLPDYSKWSAVFGKYVDAVASDMALNKKDMNTAMRDQEEKANKELSEVKAAMK